MKKCNSILEYREELKRQLHEWMPDNDDLISKELSIFDSIVTRRDFLKTSSLAAAMFSLGGCVNHRFIKPPSMWDENWGDAGYASGSSVSRASKITIDSDIMDGIQQYRHLAARGSDDAGYIVDDAILESFNPHIITTQSKDALVQSGLKPVDRNYGTAEIVQLCQKNGSDYYLDIHEESRDGSQGLKSSIITLEGTSSYQYDYFVVANGSHHNRIADQEAYSQKMLLLANTVGNQAPKLFYQAGSSPLLMPGVQAIENWEWQSLDIIEEFIEAEDALEYENYTVVDIGSYEDGSNHNFIYGTLRFDDFYNYGFTITFASITDSKPTITFFAPYFLSHKSSTIEKLNANFNRAFSDSYVDVIDGTSLKDFSLFGNQKFIPFAQMTNSDGTIGTNVLFSFICFDTTTDISSNGTADIIDDELDLSHFCTVGSTIIKRYLISVDTSGGIAYPMGTYEPPEPSVELDNDYFTLTFDTSAIPTLDIWSTLYDPEQTHYSDANPLLKNSYVRSTKTDDTSIEIILAHSFFDGKDLGVTHHALTLKHKALENFSLEHTDIFSNTSTMDEAKDAENNDYKNLWFGDMVGSSNSYQSIAECINADNGYYDFYCTHNRQGLLRSYFIVNVNSSDTQKFSHSFLLNFNESGNIGENQIYAFQTHENLMSQIQDNEVKKYPPLPITLNPKKMHRWRTVGQDEEVLYTAKRTYETNKKTRELKPNSGDRTLLSYHHASMDPLEGSWVTQEYTAKVPADANPQDYSYKTTKHHVHLHTNNIYDHPAILKENRYIEVRFTKAVTVTDMTDTKYPKTYGVGRFSSLFFRTDNNGRVSLEINAGVNNHDMFKGVTMLYRFIEHSDLQVEDDQPIAIISDPGSDTSDFMRCNISFRQFERLSTKNIGHIQPGAPSDTQPLGDTMRKHLKEGNGDNLDKITDAFDTLYQHSRPDNDTAPETISRVSSKILATEPILFCGFVHTGMQKSYKVALHPNEWASTATDTISNALNTLADVSDDLAEAVRRALNKLIDDISEIVSELSQPMERIINKLIIIWESILKISMLNYYLAWLSIKALLDVEGAWKSGHEIKRLFDDQLKPGGNTYNIVKGETAKLKTNIDSFINNIKNNIDDDIDQSMNRYDNKHQDEKRSLNKKRQRNSTRSHYTQDQMKILFSAYGVSAPAAHSISTDCNNGDTVEELVSCIISNEIKTVSSGVQSIVNDNMSLLYDVMHGGTGEALCTDLANMQKDCVNLMLDQMSIVSKGTIQIPLAFLNGSSLLNAAYDEVNGAMHDVFEMIGLILFQDKDKFKTLDDFGYFFVGEMINFFLIFTEDIQKLIGFDMDVKSYLQDGEFRSNINTASSVSSAKMLLLGDEEHGGLETAVLVAELLDLFVEIIHFSMDFAKIVEGEEPYEVFGRFLILARVIFRVPKLIEHSCSTDANIKIWGIATDILFMATMAINFGKKGYSWARPLESEARLGWGIAYTFVNTLTRVFGLTVSIIKVNQEDAGAAETLELIKSSISLLQAFMKFYIETVPEPDPRVVGVNVALTGFKIVDIYGILLAESIE